LIALSLLNFINFEPGIFEVEVGADIGEFINDLLFFSFEGGSDVLDFSVECLLFDEAGGFVILLPGDESFEMFEFPAFNDGGGGEPEVSACFQSYLAMLLARVKTILIIK
jgi:hypothetical protein